VVVQRCAFLVLIYLPLPYACCCLAGACCPSGDVAKEGFRDAGRSLFMFWMGSWSKLTVDFTSIPNGSTAACFNFSIWHDAYQLIEL
jgi:hypothetical protein